MYNNTEVIIRLDHGEVQQALAIWLDGDVQQALGFLKEKVVDKTWQATCKRSAADKTALCRLGVSNCSCCRAMAVGKGRRTGTARAGSL